jgi:ABC-2 type transport system ATP-binding protein
VEPLFLAQNVSKRFGKVQAVDDISLALPPGTGLGLIGPNASGKSTLIKCCVGLLKPEEGRITVCGHAITDGDVEARRNLAYAAELPDTVGAFTAWDHLAFTASMIEIRGWEGDAERLLHAFDLWPKRNKLVAAFSKGERQKVMLATALFRRPRVLFLDEPLIGIDPRAAHALKAEVRALIGAGSSVVICSHTLALVEELCGMLAVLSRGKLVFVGTPDGLRAAAQGSKDASLEAAFVRVTEPGAGGESGS